MTSKIQNIKFIGTGPEITGIFTDTISNTSLGVWDFGGASLTNCTITGSDQLSNLDTTFFVHADFTAADNFYNTIQDAIDATAESDGHIIVFPGDYEGFSMSNRINTTIEGVGKVNIITPMEGNLWINFASCVNCSITNISLVGVALGAAGIYMDNSSVSLDKVNMTFTLTEVLLTTGVTTRTFVSGTTDNNDITIKDCNFYLDSTLGTETLEDVTEYYFNFIKLDTASKKITLNNNNFSLVSRPGTFEIDILEFSFIDFAGENINPYFMKINNCSFYSDISAHTEELTTFNNITGHSTSIPNISVTNSFTNESFSDLLRQSNNVEDSFYQI